MLSGKKYGTHQWCPLSYSRARVRLTARTGCHLSSCEQSVWMEFSCTSVGCCSSAVDGGRGGCWFPLATNPKQSPQGNPPGGCCGSQSTVLATNPASVFARSQTYWLFCTKAVAVSGCSVLLSVECLNARRKHSMLKVLGRLRLR